MLEVHLFHTVVCSVDVGSIHQKVRQRCIAGEAHGILARPLHPFCIDISTMIFLYLLYFPHLLSIQHTLSVYFISFLHFPQYKLIFGFAHALSLQFGQVYFVLSFFVQINILS